MREYVSYLPHRGTAFRLGCRFSFFIIFFLCKNITKDIDRATGARICIFPFVPGNSVPVGMSVFFFYYIFLCKNITKDIGRTNVGEMDLSSATKKTLTTIRYGRYVAKLDDMTWSVFCLRILGKYPKFVIHCTFYRTLYRV